MQKKIAVINDISGFGRCSTTVTLPILSYLGVQCCPVPTAILSNHMGYPYYYIDDYTDRMGAYIANWRKLGLKFEGIMTGFLGSAKQIDIVKDFIRDFSKKDTLVTVDPVMGDHGKIYVTYTDRMCTEMKRLVALSNITTPNLTEAAFLLGREVCGARGAGVSAGVSAREAEEWCVELAGMGPEYSIVTSAPAEEPGRIATLAYDRREGKLWRVCCEELPASYPGTGDAFASAVTGGLLRGETLPEAVARAVYFIHEGIRETMACEHDPLDGMHQEKVLHCLAEEVRGVVAEPVERGR